MDYPFTIVEMRLDKNDKGEGKILGGHEDLTSTRRTTSCSRTTAQQPVRFNEIKKVK